MYKTGTKWNRRDHQENQILMQAPLVTIADQSLSLSTERNWKTTFFNIFSFFFSWIRAEASLEFFLAEVIFLVVLTYIHHRRWIFLGEVGVIFLIHVGIWIWGEGNFNHFYPFFLRRGSITRLPSWRRQWIRDTL